MPLTTYAATFNTCCSLLVTDFVAPDKNDITVVYRLMTVYRSVYLSSYFLDIALVVIVSGTVHIIDVAAVCRGVGIIQR